MCWYKYRIIILLKYRIFGLSMSEKKVAGNFLSNNFWNLFLFSAFVVLILLPLFQKGTFIDGTLYKTVAFNQSIQVGNFWTMKYTNTCMPVFCEQPPLYPSLLGYFYRMFGSHYLVDRVFTLLLFLILFLFLKSCIRQVFGKTHFFFPLTLFFTLSIPVFCWSYVNQVIEPLVCVFIAAGILFFIRYLQTGTWLNVLLFAVTIYLCFLTKGFQSCFLIVLPAAYFLVSRFSVRALYISLLAGGLLTLCLFITLRLYQPAMTWFDCYYNARVVLTLQNVGNTTDSHAEIVVRFFTELLIPICLLVILTGYLNIKKKYPVRFLLKNFVSNKLAVALLITSFAGSLPYAISLVQRGFYLVPSFICFILALVLGFRRYWLFTANVLIRIGKYKVAQLVLMLIFVSVVIYFFVNVSGYKREKELLTDVELILPYLQKNDTVLVEPEMWNYFNLHSYLYMEKQVSLVTSGNSSYRYFICSKRLNRSDLPANYKKITLATSELELMEIISNQKSF